MTIKEYQKDLNKDVSDFLTELQQKFPDMVITSGFRKNSVTKFGKKSRHSTGEAADLRINPEISDWLYNTKEGITTLNKYGLGMLDESLPENKKFGNAIHIGKDAVPVERARNRYKELFGAEYGQEPQPQEQENIINYVSPTQNTTIVTNLPKSEESINFAEETRKLEQQKQEEFQKIEQEINQRTQVQPQEQQTEEEEYVQPTPQINYQDIFNQVSQFVDTPIAQQGGIKTDPMGYWNPENLNRPVIIPSPSISMKNIDFSVLGVADTGETKLMHPNEEHYFSGAKKVTEYPIEYIKKLRNGR